MKAWILMADIVDSSSHNSTELMSVFKQLVKQANAAFTDDISSPLTITLGDEFQGVVKGLEEGIRLLIFMEEALIQLSAPFQLRWVLNQGEIDTEINTTEAYGMLGEGLSIAREQLALYKKSGDRFHVYLEDIHKKKVLNESLYLYQHLMETWHAKDLEVASLFIQGKNYKEVAELTGRDESTTWRREKSLGIKAYKTCKSLIFKLVA